jgi:hypothetical protein
MSQSKVGLIHVLFGIFNPEEIVRKYSETLQWNLAPLSPISISLGTPFTVGYARKVEV